jgi:hypothetical protein
VVASVSTKQQKKHLVKTDNGIYGKKAINLFKMMSKNKSEGDGWLSWY